MATETETEPTGPAPVCPRCSGAGDTIDNLGDGEHALCLRCGLCWVDGGHADQWPCPVCLIGNDVALERVRAILHACPASMRLRMYGAARLLYEPACTELRNLLAVLSKIEDAIACIDPKPVELPPKWSIEGGVVWHERKDGVIEQAALVENGKITTRAAGIPVVVALELLRVGSEGS